MSVVPAASLLMDFGSNEPAAAIAEEILQSPVTVADDAGEPKEAEAAYARGLEEGKAAALAEAEARLEEQKATFKEELATSREAWCREEGTRICEQIELAMRGMEDRIAQCTEHVLRPFLTQTVREQAIVSLRATLQELVATSPELTLEISGPRDLLEAVRANLPASAAAVSYVENEACDVQVKAGASLLETRIAAWLQQIEGRAS